VPIRAQRPQPEPQSSPHLPPGPEALICDQFQGINTSTSRVGVKNEQMWWSDGFLQIGPRLFRTLPGISAAVWSVSSSSEPLGTTIVFFDFANIGSTPYSIVTGKQTS